MRKSPRIPSSASPATSRRGDRSCFRTEGRCSRAETASGTGSSTTSRGACTQGFRKRRRGSSRAPTRAASSRRGAVGRGRNRPRPHGSWQPDGAQIARLGRSSRLEPATTASATSALRRNAPRTSPKRRSGARLGRAPLTRTSIPWRLEPRRSGRTTSRVSRGLLLPGPLAPSRPGRRAAGARLGSRAAARMLFLRGGPEQRPRSFAPLFSRAQRSRSREGDYFGTGRLFERLRRGASTSSSTTSGPPPGRPGGSLAEASSNPS